MATLSEKYVAGFLDSDGSIGMQFRADCAHPLLVLRFSQLEDKDAVIHRIAAEYVGAVGSVCAGTATAPQGQVARNRQTILTLGPKASRLLLQRIHKYMVVKRRYAEVCLDLIEQTITKDDHDRVKAYLKAQRKVPSEYMPNYPSRKWLAGYLDGDGCFSVARISKFGNASLLLHVAAATYDDVGIRLLQKAFGGRLHPMCNGSVTQWCLALPPSKALEIIDHCGQYMVVKRAQAYVIKGCAQMGHYRDGRNIKEALKQLKAHPHRLSEPDTDVTPWLDKIHDVPPRPRQDYGDFFRNAGGRIMGKHGVSDSRDALSGRLPKFL